MRKFVSIVLTFSFLQIQAYAQNIDSIATMALKYASQNDCIALAPLQKEFGKDFPPHISLYCDMVQNRNEGKYDAMIACIDSLRDSYAYRIPTPVQLSLAEWKAEGLRYLGLYDSLVSFCRVEIDKFEDKRLDKSLMTGLNHYLRKGRQLSGSTPRAQLLRFVDQYRIFELDSLFQKEKSNLDNYARLVCESTLEKAFQHRLRPTDTSRQLIEDFADSLCTKDLHLLSQDYANELMLDGNWKDLDSWANYLKQNLLEDSTTIDYYQSTARTFTEHPPFNVILPHHDCTIATTHEWPILIKGEISEGQPEYFGISTEFPHTLLSETTARRHQVAHASDTIRISTPFGVGKVCPAIIKRIKIGDITFENTFAYILLDVNGWGENIHTILGSHCLVQLSRISFYPEKIYLPYSPSDGFSKAGNRNLYFTTRGELHAPALINGTRTSMCIDINSPNNLLPADSYAIARQNVPVRLGKENFSISRPVTVEGGAYHSNGILGLPFFRTSHCLTIDFDKMNITANGEAGYAPVRGNFGQSTDKHYLRRNAPSLYVGMDNEEATFLRLLIAQSKNAPHIVAECSKLLRQENSDFYNLYSEAESHLSSNSYEEAYSLLQQAYEHKDSMDMEWNLDLQELLSKSQLFRNLPKFEIHQSQSLSHIERTKKKWSKIIVNSKKIMADFNLFGSSTQISEKTARSLDLEIIGSTETKTYALINHIAVGNIEMRNVPCQIIKDKSVIKKELPDKGKGINLGWDILRHFGYITYRTKSLEFSLDSTTAPNDGIPLYNEGQWYIEAESEGEYTNCNLTGKGTNFSGGAELHLGGMACGYYKKHHFHKRKNSSKNIISLEYLLTKVPSITFDLKDMQLFIKDK